MLVRCCAYDGKRGIIFREEKKGSKVCCFASPSICLASLRGEIQLRAKSNLWLFSFLQASEISSCLLSWCVPIVCGHRTPEGRGGGGGRRPPSAPSLPSRPVEAPPAPLGDLQLLSEESLLGVRGGFVRPWSGLWVMLGGFWRRGGGPSKRWEADGVEEVLLGGGGGEQRGSVPADRSCLCCGSAWGSNFNIFHPEECVACTCSSVGRRAGCAPSCRAGGAMPACFWRCHGWFLARFGGFMPPQLCSGTSLW